MADGLSARDSRLLKYFLKQISPEEVHNMHPDWPIEGIIAGTKRIISNFSTVYSEAERLAGNQIATARLIDWLSKQVFEENDLKAAKDLKDTLKNQLTEINAAQKRTDVELNTVRTAEAMKLAELAYGALNRLAGRLEERYGEIDRKAIESEYEGILLEMEAENE